MHRRSFLTGLASVPLLALTGAGCSSPSTSARPTTLQPRLKNVERAELGTTFVLGLDTAPFASEGYEDDTVVVFVPAHYQYERLGVDAIVHFHGVFTTAEQEVATYELREQLVASKQNAVLVAPQLAVEAADPWCGKLENAGAFESLLADVIAVASAEARAFGDAPFPDDAPLGTVCLAARSNGYHAAASCLRHGGVEVRDTYLFDALYGDVDVFHDWLVDGVEDSRRRHRRLVSDSPEGSASETQGLALTARLERARGVRVQQWRHASLARPELPTFARASQPASALAWERTALRTALVASL